MVRCCGGFSSFKVNCLKLKTTYSLSLQRTKQYRNLKPNNSQENTGLGMHLSNRPLAYDMHGLEFNLQHCKMNKLLYMRGLNIAEIKVIYSVYI
jgi:hypothetical protein